MTATAENLMLRPPGELARMVREGEVSSRELVEEALARIATLDPEVNAFNTLDAERALETADSIKAGDGRRFAGVPIAIKDLNPVEGIRLTMGSDLFGDYVPDHDAFLVRRLKDAGFVVVGTTATPEVGILPVTEPRRFGPTRNPWNLDRTPGGSSGGAGAAVASGMVPVAHGSDGGGSIRIPAACCGLVGLKPSRGRVSMGPDVGDNAVSVQGSLARTVGDAAAMLDVLAGYEPGDFTWAPPPVESFADQARREPGALRIAMTVEPPIDAPIDPSCSGAVTDAAALLQELGHEVVEATPPWRQEGVFHMFSAVFGGQIALATMIGEIVSGRKVSEETVEPLTAYLYNRARDLDSLSYLGALTRLQVFAREIVTWAEGYDAILCPSLAERPVPIGEIDACDPDPAATFARSGLFTPFTAMANVTGQPAISLPLFHGDDGLPLGIQLIGRPAGEGALLALSSQLEAARPWADRRPPIASGTPA